MKAKFEKFYVDKYHGSMRKDSTYAYTDGHTFEHNETWQAAIRSIEVTPDLAEIASRAFLSHLGYMRAITGPDLAAMQAALTAVFAKLKEQP